MRRWLERLIERVPVLGRPRKLRDALAGIQVQLAFLYKVEVARSIDLLRWHEPRFRDPRRLLLYGFQVNSQLDEDGILREIFRRIGTDSRVFLEIGSGDGVENNTAFLLPQGWRGFWLEFRDEFRRRSDLQPYLADGRLKAARALLTRENVAGHARELGVPSSFDLLSIDVDQNTYFIWEGLREFDPRVVVIEYNASIPPDLDWTVRYAPDRGWDGTRNFGAGLKALERLGRELGYCLVGCNLAGSNAFFVRGDLVGEAFAPPFTAENHYEPPRYELVQTRGHAPAVLDPGDTG